MRITSLCFLGAAVAALIAGCGSAEPGTSTITGTLDQASFPAPVESIAVISDSAAPTSVAVAADGSFSIGLTEGQSYRFTLGADGTVPLILRTEGDRLQTMIKITGGDARVDIGKVRFWAGSAASSGAGAINAVPETEPGTTTTEDACVDGLMSRSGQPCAIGEAIVTCEESGDHDGMRKPHHGMGHGDRPPPPESEEITFDAATDASREQAVAIPERTLATGIGCGGCPGM